METSGSCTHCVNRTHPCIALVPIFSHLDETEMAEIASITVERHFAKGEGIYRSGDRIGRLYVLHQGLVKIYRISADGKEQVIRTISATGFFGELALFNDQPVADHADAVEDCTMCMIEGRRLKTLMTNHPSIALKVLSELSRRLDETERNIEHITLQSAEQRLATYLVDAAAGAHECSLGMSKGDVASHLGMTQETLSRKLRAFQEARLIALKGQRGVVLLDGARLQDIADGLADL